MFISSFLPGIRGAPLQVYHAGLVFTPSDSILGRSFSHLCSSEWRVQLPLSMPKLSSSLHTFDGKKKSRIHSIAFSDEDILAWGEESGSIRVVNAASGQLLRELEWPDHPIVALAFGVEGQLASASHKGETRIWDPKIGKLIRTIPAGVSGRRHTTTPMTFSKSDDFLCIVHDKEHASMYDWHDGKLKVRRSFSDTTQVVLSQNGQWFGASSGSVLKIFGWSTDLDEQSKSFSCETEIEEITFSTNDMLLAAAFITPDSMTKVTIWNRVTGSVVKEIDMPRISITSIILTQFTIVLGTRDGRLVKSDVEPNTLPQHIATHHGAIKPLAVSKKYDMIASVATTFVAWDKKASEVKIWDTSQISSTQNSLDNTSKLGPDVSLQFGYAAKTIISEVAGDVKLWNAGDGTLVLSAATLAIAAVKTEPHFAILEDSVISMWDSNVWRVKYEIPAEACEALTFSANGKKLLSVGQSARRPFFHVYDSQTGQPEWDGALNISMRLRRPKVALHADRSSTRIAIGDMDNDRIHTIEKVTRASRSYDCPDLDSLAFLNNGAQIVAVTSDWSGWVMDFTDGKKLFYFENPAGSSVSRPLSVSFFEKSVIPDKDHSPEDHLYALMNGHHISYDGGWIMHGTQRSLWLPEDFHEAASAISGPTLALYVPSTGLWILNLIERTNNTS